MTNPLKTARCCISPNEMIERGPWKADRCMDCIRPSITAAPKQAWQYPPKQNTDGTCPSFLPEPT